VIKYPATRLVAAAVLVVGLAIAPLLDKDDLIDAPLSPPRPAQAAQFEIRWWHDELTLSGHTSSANHEHELLQAAENAYPDRRVVTRFNPLGTVPVYWEDVTTQIIDLLAEAESAQATLLESNLTIKSVIRDESDWQTRLDDLKHLLPAQVRVVSDALVVDADISAADVCGRSFATFETGQINFEESSVKFRSSAYPRLDRVIALAHLCRDSRIHISGHTDSSGNEDWNKSLSVQRANAVGDYIVQGGIDHSRLQISGVGSSEPIADDNTRYGRSLNRRIEINLSGDE